MRRSARFLKLVQVGTFGLSLIQIGCRSESPAPKATPAPSVIKPSAADPKPSDACEQAAAFACNELGKDSGVCGMMAASKEKMDPSRCAAMLANPSQTLADFRQLEESRLPLNAEKQAMLVAGDPPALGPKDAKVTVVLFSDFQCERCIYMAHYAANIPRYFGNKVKVVFRQRPSQGAYSFTAAEASLAAHAQGAFWLYFEKLYNNQHDINRATLLRCGEEIGIDTAILRDAIDYRTFKEVVETDVALAETVFAGPAPYFFVNGRRVSTLDRDVELKRAIEGELSKAH